MAAYDDLPSAWKQALPPHSDLQQTPAPPSSAPSSAPASTAPPDTAPPSDAGPPVGGGWGSAVHNAANAVIGGMATGLGNITSNLSGGYLPAPQVPADVQAAMQAHPVFAGAGNVISTAPIGLGVGAGLGALAGTVGVGGGFLGDTALGAATGAAQNALAGNPDESLARRAGTGAVLGAGFGAAANRVGSWLGAGRSIPSEVADAAQTAKAAGVTDINLSNLPGRGDIKATGATPTYAQAGQIDNAVSKILGQDVQDFKPANLNAVKNSIGGDVSKAANSGQINAAPGGAFDQALTQVQQFANANNAGPSISPMINQIRGRIQNGVISGKDFDNLVGAGSPLHDLTGDDNPFVKQAAQALDKVMDTGFQASSPPGAYDAWVDARTRYRMLMGVEKAVLPNGHIDPTALFRTVLNRFTDMKGVPVSNDPLVGRMGKFASSIKTLFGGGAAPPSQSAAPGLWQTIKELGVGSVPAAANALVSGNLASPENFLTPSSMAGWGAAGVDLLGQWAGRAYQQSRPFANALINAGGAPIANPLMPAAPAIGTQAFPQRQSQ